MKEKIIKTLFDNYSTKGVKNLNIPDVINQVCDTEINKRDSQGFLADHNRDMRV